MNRRHSFAHRLALLLCLALTACGTASTTAQVDEQEREIAALQQQLAGLTARLEQTRAKWDPLLAIAAPITDSPPPLEGTVTKVVEPQFRVHIAHNPDATDLRAFVSRSSFHIGIYDEHGFKADALAIDFDTADSCLLCWALSLDVLPSAGDRAVTASFRAAPSNDRTRTKAALRQQVADRTRELKLADEIQDMMFICGRPATPTPELAGIVTEVADRHCTIRIDDNPKGVGIAAWIARRPFRVGVFDANGYKAEVVSQRYDATTASLFCNVMFVKDGTTLTTGDRASTK